MVRRTHGTGEAAPEKPEPIAASALAAGSNTGADAMLLSFVESFERLSEEIGALTDDRKEIMSEAKSHGFDTKTMRKAIARRAMDPQTRAEGDAMLDLYETALERGGKNARQQSVDDGE